MDMRELEDDMRISELGGSRRPVLINHQGVMYETMLTYAVGGVFIIQTGDEAVAPDQGEGA